MEFKFNLHHYWSNIPLKDANYEEYLASFEPLLKELEKNETANKQIRDVELFLYLKNNPLLLQLGNEKDSRLFLANFSKLAVRDLYHTLLGFLFICKYDFEGFMGAYEKLFLKFPTKDLSLNSKGDYLINPSEVSNTIQKIYGLFFEGCVDMELRRLRDIDPEKFEERKAAVSNYKYEPIKEFVESALIQEGRSKNDGIEFEYFCEHIFPKIKLNVL